MREIQKIKRIIIKVGSSSLCNEDGVIDKEKILHLVLQISKLKHFGYEIVLVSSGAIAAGRGIMKYHELPSSMPEKQALAAIGQAKLMQIYEEIFQLFKIQCAQILLNHDDFHNQNRLLNLTNTLDTLLEFGIIPIVNENDALSVDEIKVGDNDTLSALLVPVVEADLLILVSDIDGLYTADPSLNKNAKLLKYVERVDEKIMKMATGTTSALGTGGMATKINAAKFVNDYGSHMVIVNGQTENSILHIFDEVESGTWFNKKS